MPLDPESSPLGKVFVAIEDGKYIGRVVSKRDPKPPGKPFVAHFLTCNTKPAAAAPAKPPPPPPPPTLF